MNVNSVTQDGYESGDFGDLRVGDGGRLYGVYSNGQVVALAQLAVAQFAASNALLRKDGGAFEATLESGQPFSPMPAANLWVARSRIPTPILQTSSPR